MPHPLDIKTPLALAKWVGNILGDKWRLSVDETSSVYLGSYGSRKTYEWRFFAWCSEPLKIHVSVSAKSFAGLVKVVDRDLWEAIREEFLKSSIQWVRPGSPDRIESPQRKIGVKPPVARRPALPNKQLALTHTPAVAPQKSKQLLLLPPQPVVSCCNWPGCSETISPKAWACTPHWQALPSVYREQIIDLYRPGEAQSAEFLAYTSELKAQIKRYPALFKIKD